MGTTDLLGMMKIFSKQLESLSSKLTILYIENGWIGWYVNDASIKLIEKGCCRDPSTGASCLTWYN